MTKNDIVYATATRESRRKNKMPFTLWRIVETSTNETKAVSTYSACLDFLAKNSPRRKKGRKVENKFHIEKVDLTNSNLEI